MYIDYSIQLIELHTFVIVGNQHLFYSQILREYIEIYRN